VSPMSDLHDLSGTTYEHLRLRDARFVWIDLARARVDHAGLRDVRMRGVELENVEIEGELQNVVVNGVDVVPLVEAELARRDPDHAKMKPQDAAGFREAWAILGDGGRRRSSEPARSPRRCCTSVSTASGRSSRRSATSATPRTPG
jgi:hypothetical protein